MNDSCSDTELGMGGGGGDNYQHRDRDLEHTMPIKREMDQEEVFYKSMLASHQREFLTAGNFMESLSHRPLAHIDEWSNYITAGHLKKQEWSSHKRSPLPIQKPPRENKCYKFN